MKRIITLIIATFYITCNGLGGNTQVIEESITTLDAKFERLAKENKSLQQEISKLKDAGVDLDNKIAALEAKSDSVDNEIKASVNTNAEVANTNHKNATQKIEGVETNSENSISHLAMWGIVAIVVLLLIATIVYIILHRGLSKSSDAISTIRKAQGNLEKAQSNIKEESVKLDTKLIGLLEKQLEIESAQKAFQSGPDVTPTTQPTVDHSLALKVADEITRIEKNLSRMDESIKGYKPLVKAIERIKNNFKANGYEIVTYLGQPYNEGMRINTEFIIDEEIPVGTRVITAVSKPQVHYKGELIQKASVTVTQNI